jgi:predicted phosphoadenosine phosphosulfate sulfurtransferase
MLPYKIIKTNKVKRLQLLETLPENIKNLAILRISESVNFWNSKGVTFTTEKALAMEVNKLAGLKGSCSEGYFKFSQTPEGFNFWDKINSIYFK